MRPASARPARRAQAGVPGQRYSLGPGRDLQLRQHGGDVIPHGLVRYHQAAADGQVAAALGQQVKYLALAGGQPRKGHRPAAPGRRGEEGDDPVGDARAEYRLAARDRPDRAPDVIGAGLLEQVARAPARSVAKSESSSSLMVSASTAG